MPLDAGRNHDLGRFRNSRSQRHVRAAPIVENDELLKNGPQMALTDWNDVIETLAPNASDQALAEAIALGRPHWSLQHSQTHPSNRAIDVSREDRVAVVNEETVLVLGIKELAKLLGSPFGGRMRRQAGRPIGGLSDEAPCRLEARRSACAGGRRSRPVTGEGLPGSERRRYARREPQFR